MDTNVKDGYECYDWLSIWYRLGLVVYVIWLQMLRMATNVMIDFEFDIVWSVECEYECWWWIHELDAGWIWFQSNLNTNVKDGYECYHWILMSSSYFHEYECWGCIPELDKVWIWLLNQFWY